MKVIYEPRGKAAEYCKRIERRGVKSPPFFSLFILFLKVKVRISE